jgi:uncharacterized C2H2 Zn-finger protein
MPPSCRRYQRSFDSRTTFQQHLESSAHSQRWKICSKPFRNQQALQQHVNSPTHRCGCDDCGKTFRTQQALQQHLDSPTHCVECHLCDGLFQDQASYLRHHFRAPFFLCIPCHRSFEPHAALRQHMSHSPNHIFNTQRVPFSSLPTSPPFNSLLPPSAQLDEDDLNSLTDREGTICKEELNLDEESSHLLYNHWFHWSCITSWVEIRATSPCCRTVLPNSAEAEQG